MNRTVTVNISGFVFQIEEKGFEMLRHYLDRLQVALSGTAGRDEIIADIEARIAELFRARLADSREVVTEADVAEVTEILGRPEDIADAAEGPEPAAAGSTYEGKRTKRLYRDPDGRTVAGVATGLAHYFGVDPAWVRIIFVLLTIFGGSGVPIYIILWVVLPEAKSTAEKLEMTGQPVNLDNIKRKVEEELKTAETHIKRGARKAEEAFDKAKPGDVARKFADALSSIFGSLGVVLVKIIGFMMLLAGIGWFFWTVVGLVAWDWIIESGMDTGQWIELIFSSQTAIWTGIVALVLLALVPGSWLIYSGMRLLGIVAKPIRGIGWAFSFLIIIGTIAGFVSGTITAKDFSRSGEVFERTMLTNHSSDTLNISIAETGIFTYDHKQRNRNPEDVIVLKDEMVYSAHNVRLRFETAESGSLPWVEVARESRGPNRDAAREKAENIRYDWQADSTGIALSSVISFPAEDKLRAQDVTVVIGVPEGKVCRFDERIRRVYSKKELGAGHYFLEDKKWRKAD
jgi:phage shock protein PspC (stress-responsive transcriptional regulator)